MSNMSYCRFRNTLTDLQDCQEAMSEPVEDLSAEEFRARKNLIKLAKEIAEEFGDEEE